MTELVEVRASVNLHGLRAGETAIIDASDAWMQGALRNGWLVPIEEEDPHDSD